jgi:hypothetical protein
MVRAFFGSFVSLVVAPIVFAGCGASRSETRTSTVSDDKTTTVVAVSVDPNAPSNPACESFCRRLAECWYAIPNVDTMSTKEKVTADCRAEYHACQDGTTSLDCCTNAGDCQAFAHCYTTARGSPSTCGAE